MTATAKLFSIVECFSRSDRELSLAQIAQRTGVPKPTARRLLTDLQALGYIEQAAPRRNYALGLKFFEIGSIVLDTMDLSRVARPIVLRLQQISGESVHLCVFNGMRPVLIAQRQMDVPPLNTVTTLEAAAAHCTGVGKAALAFQSAASIQRVIAEGLHPYTGNTITDPAALELELAQIRACGYAIDNGEHQASIRCVAAPIRAASGAVVAAISVSTIWARLPDDRLPAVCGLVIAAASDISSALGAPDAA